MRRYFTYGDFDSRNFPDLYVSGKGSLKMPERDVEKVAIPGRNGDIIVDNGRFKNVTIPYTCFVGSSFIRRFNDIKHVLKLPTGYQRIEDNYDPDVYRLGSFIDAVEGKPGSVLRHGLFDVLFDCMPQRFLKSGEEQVPYSCVSKGGFDSSGANIDLMSTYRIEYIPVEPGKTFSVYADYSHTSISTEVLTVAWYNSSKNHVGLVEESVSGLHQKVETIVPSGVAYARVMFGSGTTFYSGAKGVRIQYDGKERTYGDGGIFLQNPTGYVAKPILRFTGVAGNAVRVMHLGEDNNRVAIVTDITVSDFSATMRDDIAIDSVAGDAYSEYISAFFNPLDLNYYVSITDYDGNLADYPLFEVGGTLIKTDNNTDGTTSSTMFETMTVQSNWWTV